MKCMHFLFEPYHVLVVLFLALLVGCTPYMKMNPPADSDKPLPVPVRDNLTPVECISTSR
jgi:hypothetical protein